VLDAAAQAGIAAERIAKQVSLPQTEVTDQGSDVVREAFIPERAPRIPRVTMALQLYRDHLALGGELAGHQLLLHCR